MKISSKLWTIREAHTKGAVPFVVKLSKPRSGHTRSWKRAEKAVGMLWFGERDPETLRPVMKP